MSSKYVVLFVCLFVCLFFKVQTFQRALHGHVIYAVTLGRIFLQATTSSIPAGAGSYLQTPFL